MMGVIVEGADRWFVILYIYIQGFSQVQVPGVPGIQLLIRRERNNRVSCCIERIVTNARLWDYLVAGCRADSNE